MNERFHPFTLGEILDRTAQMYRARFLRFVGIAALPTVVILAFVVAAMGIVAIAAHLEGTKQLSNTQSIAMGSVLVVVVLVALPVCLGAMALSWAALTDAAVTTFQGGTFTIRGAYGNVWKRRWRLLWLLTMDVLFVGVIPASVAFAIFLIPGLGAALADQAGMGGLSVAIGIAMFVLMAAVVAAAVWLLLRLCLGFAACVAEQVSAWQALKRSGVLSKGTRGRLFVLFLLGYALESGFSIASFFVVVIVVMLVPGMQGAKNADAASTAMALGFYALSFVVQALVRPVYGIGLTLFYFDQRIRKEGFDIEWMMQHAGMLSAASPVEEPAAQAEASPWLTLPNEPVGGAGK